ncbi:MAG TPA: phenylalanine 4-monooxygenase [Bacteroidetes bacterium]|nr:phenylalanine 4-monooxygenase [Bacteroidota bacterium]
MFQQYENYTTDDHTTWKLLFERQEANLSGKACTDFLLTLSDLGPELVSDQIPNFRALNKRLWASTGWTIEVVPGLIPVGEFFELLSRRRFCSSTWIRKREQLDYLEEPDMFHDIFGHIPLLTNPTYADFMQKFGEIGTKYAGNPAIERQLERLYWFTIEFGLLMERGQPRIYGAGLASSFGEANQIFSGNISILPFEIEKIINHDFRNDVMQTEYYAIASFEALWKSLDGIDALLGKGVAAQV